MRQQDDDKDSGADAAAGGNDTPVVTPERQAHTPGPWKWFNYPDGRKLLCAANRAVVFCPDAPMDIDPPDAHLIAAAPEMSDAAEMLWVVLANVSGGDWTKQSAEWQEAATRWRDNYFAALAKSQGTKVGTGNPASSSKIGSVPSEAQEKEGSK